MFWKSNFLGKNVKHSKKLNRNAMIFWCLNVGNSIDLGESYYKDNQVIDFPVIKFLNFAFQFKI